MNFRNYPLACASCVEEIVIRLARDDVISIASAHGASVGSIQVRDNESSLLDLCQGCGHHFVLSRV
jgi:hypothetical protein